MAKLSIEDNRKVYRVSDGNGGHKWDWYFIKQEGVKILVLLVGFAAMHVFSMWVNVRDLGHKIDQTTASVLSEMRQGDTLAAVRTHRLAEAFDTFTDCWWKEKHPKEPNPMPKIGPTMPAVPSKINSNGGNK